MKKPALGVTPGKKMSILQSGEILKEESAAIKTVVPTIWGIPQFAVPTSISVFTRKAFTCFFLHELKEHAFQTGPPVHRGAFSHFPFRWIYYSHGSKFTRKTGKTHLCAVYSFLVSFIQELCIIIHLKML